MPHEALLIIGGVGNASHDDLFMWRERKLTHLYSCFTSLESNARKQSGGCHSKMNDVAWFNLQSLSLFVAYIF
jgi:hypothetical protein